MCEMAQELIKLRAQTNNWSIPTYPGKVKLPADILRPQPDAETANKVRDNSDEDVWMTYCVSTDRKANLFTIRSCFMACRNHICCTQGGNIPHNIFIADKTWFRRRKNGNLQPSVKPRQRTVIQSGLIVCVQLILIAHHLFSQTFSQKEKTSRLE